MPPQYYALGERVAARFVADILTLQMPKSPLPPLPKGNGVRSLAHDPEAIGVLQRAGATPRKRSGRRLAIRDVSNREVVAVIELVSPGNKDNLRDYAMFVEKAEDVLAERVHLLVIDPFPPPPHAPAGLHAAIWGRAAKRKKGKPPFTPSQDRPLIAASYCTSATELTAAVAPYAVGEAVPDIPLFLTADEEYVTLSLEATYRAARPDVPKVWRQVLEP